LAHTGSSGSVSEAPAIDRLDTRISVHTPLFLPFLERWDSGRKVGVSWGFWEKNFAKNFFDASPCVSERVVKRDIGWGDFRVRNYGLYALIQTFGGERFSTGVSKYMPVLGPVLCSKKMPLVSGSYREGLGYHRGTIGRDMGYGE